MSKPIEKHSIEIEPLYQRASCIIENARTAAYRQINEASSADLVEFDNIDIQNAIIRGIGNRTADSYFTTLKELFNL